MKITFVATKKNLDPTEREFYEMDLILRVSGFKRAFLDLGLFTVAACTPPGVRVELADEYLGAIDYDAPTDLVALSAKTSCAPAAYEVARRFRAKGKRVVLGGIHASLRPDEALEHVDAIVTGEAETLWPAVVADAAAGRLKTRYDAQGFPPMQSVPVPRWSAAPYNQYLFHQVQTTRGCPFRCRFCSVPDISGQDFRFKPVECVVRELEALPRGGGPIARTRPLYVVDDNFISRTRYTKDLLRALVPLYRAGRINPWSAETTLNVAADDELLDLLRDAGCNTLIIGFESVSEATLNDMDKPVNFCLTYQDAIANIHRRGICVMGNFIVGFDTDTRAVFKDTLDFVQRTGILYPFFSILTPMPGTALHDDFVNAGRLDHTDWGRYDTRHVVFEPKHMRRDELMDGYVWLYEQAYGTEQMLARLETTWRAGRGIAAGWLEKGVLAARLAAETVRGDREMRGLYGQALKLMLSRHLRADPAHLLFMLDGYDFARFMRRYNSPQRDANYRRFAQPDAAPDAADQAAAERAAAEQAALRAMQWDNRKAQLRSGKKKGALPVVP